MDRQSNMGYIRSFAHNAELQETPKTVKKSSKNGFFGLPRLYCKKFLHNFDENWLNGVKDIFAPKYEKKIEFANQRRAAGTPKNRQKTRFSDFRECIVESYCMNCLSGTVIIVGRGGGCVFVCFFFVFFIMGGCIVRVTVGACSSFFVFSLFGYSGNS